MVSIVLWRSEYRPHDSLGFIGKFNKDSTHISYPVMLMNDVCSGAEAVSV